MAQKGSIVPLIILLIVVGVLAAIGFVAYSIAHDVGHKTKAKLEKKNVSFSREGMKVGVKGRTQEQQEDAAQSVITKIWNNSSWPAYSSRLGWGQDSKSGGSASTPLTETRSSSARASSSSSSHHATTVPRQGTTSTTTSAQVRP